MVKSVSVGRSPPSAAFSQLHASNVYQVRCSKEVIMGRAYSQGAVHKSKWILQLWRSQLQRGHRCILQLGERLRYSTSQHALNLFFASRRAQRRMRLCFEASSSKAARLRAERGRLTARAACASHGILSRCLIAGALESRFLATGAFSLSSAGTIIA